MPNIENIDEKDTDKIAKALQNETVQKEVMEEALVKEPPDWLPLKFWDAKKGEIRLQALAKSYKLLEKRLSSIQGKKSEGSDSQQGEGAVDNSVDNLVDKIVHKREKPLNNLVDNNDNKPVDIDVDNNKGVEDAADDIDDKNVDNVDDDMALAVLELERIFGGSDNWQRLRPQLMDWGQRNLPAGTFQLLSGSVEGIKALHDLMLSSPKEPRLVEGGDLPQALDESRLRRMMEDPRYWRERDPQFVNRVLRGFQQLYGG